MKTVVFGDIHGRTVWKDIVKQENPDRVIFMGDYVSSHDNIPEVQQISNLQDILEFKKNFEGEVIMLRGNHDLQHLEYKGFECCCFCPSVYIYMNEVKEEFLNATQWVYVMDDLVFSHAGISKVFWESLDLGEPTKEHIMMINEYPVSSIFAFTPDSPFDCYGNSTCQPCTWIRPESLLSSHIDNWNQVVGHTRMKYPGDLLKYVKREDKEKYGFTMNELWCVDALPDSYMVIDEEGRRMNLIL